MEDAIHLHELSGAGKRKALRALVLSRHGGQCVFCSQPATTLDHLIPRSAGGATSHGNLVPACLRCNQLKSSLDWREWFRTQPTHSRDRESLIAEWGEKT